MNIPLTASVRTTVQRYRMLRPGDRVALAVSGGADSVALLRLFEDLSGDLGVTLCVIHFNHQLRSNDSDDDEKFVASLASTRKLDFFSGRADVAAAARRYKWNLEDAARRLRYEFFSKIIADGTATRIATAHTADDQAETVLARLIRGTGLTGLSAIHPVRGDVVRPLLAARRAHLRMYLNTIKQDWREDASNTDLRRLRARVRHALLPELECNFGSPVINKLNDLADLARDDERFWTALVEQRCTSIVDRTVETACVKREHLLWPLGCERPADLRAENPFRALTQRIIRHLYASVSVKGGELSREHVQRVIQLAESGASGRTLELPGGVKVHKDFDQLIFAIPVAAGSYAKKSPRQISYAYQIDVPAHASADVSVPELHRRFHLKVIDWSPEERETNYEGVVLDAERLEPPLILRNWEPGDAYCPPGRQHPRKLARMLMARHVSAAQRSRWPVLTSAGRVAWADRMPVGKEFSVSNGTHRGVWIVENRW